MSRKEVMSDSRCPICGGKMRLVNVTHTNTFCAPEASQYDLSVSRRKTKSVIPASTRELFCTCCGYRIPAGAAKMAKPEKEKKVKERKPQNTTATTKEVVVQKTVVKKRQSVFFWIKLFIFLAIVAAGAYFVYSYRETILNYWNQLMILVDKVMNFVETAKGFVENITSRFS